MWLKDRQLLLPYTVLTEPRRSVFTARYELNIDIIFRLFLDFKGVSRKTDLN